MKISMVQILFLIVFVGCDEEISKPTATPYEQWKANNIHNYTIDQTRSCFCIRSGEKMRLTVFADTLHSVMRLSDSTILSYAEVHWYHSVDSLFDIIRMNKQDSLVYSFDVQYGFPNMLDINPQQHPYDGGALFESSNLQPIK